MRCTWESSFQGTASWKRRKTSSSSIWRPFSPSWRARVGGVDTGCRRLEPRLLRVLQEFQESGRAWETGARSFAALLPPPHAPPHNGAIPADPPRASPPCRASPCSAGRATGTARVVEDIFGAGSIREGDILLTRYTDPGGLPISASSPASPRRQAAFFPCGRDLPGVRNPGRPGREGPHGRGAWGRKGLDRRRARALSPWKGAASHEAFQRGGSGSTYRRPIRPPSPCPTPP